MITNTKGFTGHAMGAGIEDVVAVKALETGIVPPVPNYREPDPDLGDLNLSKGGPHPVRYALRLAAGFGSQVAMALLRWTPVADGRHRGARPARLRYRIVDAAAWQRWLDALAGHDGARLEVDHRRLRVVDVGAPTTFASRLGRAGAVRRPDRNGWRGHDTCRQRSPNQRCQYQHPATPARRASRTRRRSGTRAATLAPPRPRRSTTC